MAGPRADGRGGGRSAGRWGGGWTRGERIVVGAGVLLLADLLLLPWHRYAIDTGQLAQLGIKVPSFNFDRTGVESPRAVLGILGAVVAAAMVIQVVAAKLTARVPRSGRVHLIAGPVVFGLLGAKLLTDDTFLAPGAWLGIVLAASLAYGGMIMSQESSTTPAGPSPVRND